jgi:hypothetical protein
MIAFPELVHDFEPLRRARVTIVMPLEMDTVLLCLIRPPG